MKARANYDKWFLRGLRVDYDHHASKSTQRKTRAREGGRIMLGYTEAEVRRMIGSISMFLEATSDEHIQKGLLNAIDLLQGLLEEGRI